MKKGMVFLTIVVFAVTLAMPALGAEAPKPGTQPVQQAPGQIPTTQTAPVKPPPTLQQTLPDLYCTLKVTALRTLDQCGQLASSLLTVQQGAVVKEVTGGDLLWCGQEIFKVISFEWEVKVGNKGLADTSGPPVIVATSISTNNGPALQLGYQVILQIPKGGSIPLKYTRFPSQLSSGFITVTATITYNGQEIAKENNTCTHQFTFQK